MALVPIEEPRKMSDVIGEDKDFYLKNFQGLDYAKGTVASKTFEECTFTQCSFSDAQLDHCKFIECTFRSCDLSNVKLNASKFQAVTFDECKVIGVDWTRADWPRYAAPAKLTFRKSIVNYTSFFGLSLQELVLEECKVRNVDFRQGDFARSNFTYSDFAESMFGGTKLQGADFSEATNYVMDIRENQVKGARFTRTEAAGLLYGLGIELVD
jgi:fluoroquinolone resistance protein